MCTELQAWKVIFKDVPIFSLYKSSSLGDHLRGRGKPMTEILFYKMLLKAGGVISCDFFFFLSKIEHFWLPAPPKMYQGSYEFPFIVKKPLKVMGCVCVCVTKSL